MIASLLNYLAAGYACAAITIPVVAAEAAPPHVAPPLTFDTLPAARFAFAGPVGQRVNANVEEWLLRAPQANPGMLEMFRVRDRQPVPQLVPWAGEFVGKYLISGVQALRLSEDPRLRPQVAAVVAALVASQADDGYLGPFPKSDRLLKNWDLWGHYHAILALTLWHEQAGDPAALNAARKAGDLVCRTYLDTGRRVVEAGDAEMNMAILTGMARLYRLTGEPRYLRMAREVEADWQRAGDYLRAGLDGREFFASPRPRWESLHDLQGLVELWLATGEPRYRDAFIHHWRSIRRWDRRNTGGFSSGEQATGNPYAPTPIETCCTVAWMALTVDYLRLTGDPRAADELELATLNGGLGAQHPSGRWWTYNTPMDGVREASAHTIVFQARAGTPELNCCSVNGPRVPGVLSEWAVMSTTNGLVMNWLGEGRCSTQLPSGARVAIVSHGDAWRDGHTMIRVETSATEAFPLLLRIPAWAGDVQVTLNGSPLPGASPGHYLKIEHRWVPSDALEFNCRMPLRVEPGANEMAGRVSLYRGPLLLAYDQAHNAVDEAGLPALDLAQVDRASLVPLPGPTNAFPAPPAWLALDLPTVGGGSLRLVDFASAGSAGTRYRSWLAATPTPPAPAFTQAPADAARVPAGPVSFRWRGPRGSASPFRLEFATEEAFAAGSVWSTNATGSRCTIDTRTLADFFGSPSPRLWWRVVSAANGAETIASVPAAWFRIDPTAPAASTPPEPALGPDGEIVVHTLRGDTKPKFGELKTAGFVAQNAAGTEVNGRDQMLVYAVPAWPEQDFTVALRVRLNELPGKRVGQIFSAWHSAMDDPLRLVVDGGKVHARIEAGQGYSTPGTALSTGRWYALAAVKRDATLTLFVDGREIGSSTVPVLGFTQAGDCALGGNPHYAGNEFLAAQFADFRFLARALSPAEVEALAREQ